MNRATALITANRPGGYVHETLRSLRETGFFEVKRYLPLAIYVGTPDSSYLAPYSKWDQVDIVPMTKEEMGEVGWSELNPKSRCAFAHYRAIRGLLRKPTWEEALILEDDLRFAGGWIPFLDEILREVRSAHGRRWILSLYQHYGVKEEHQKGRSWYPIKTAPYYHGGLAEIYPRTVLEQGLSEYLLEHSVRHLGLPSDWATGEFAKQRGTALLATAPCLVEHTGELGTGQSSFFHHADLFLESVGSEERS